MILGPCDAQSLTCLTADKCLTADPGIHTFLQIDHEIISMVILLPSADSRRLFQLQAEV